MEFVFEGSRWINRKTETKDCFVVRGDVRIQIPNFYETAKQYAQDNGITHYEVYFNDSYDIIPGLRASPGGGYYGAYCDIVTGQWHTTPKGSWNGELRLYELINEHSIKKENTQLRKRMEKLEAIFNHIREKSSILDEFLRVAEEATK